MPIVVMYFGTKRPSQYRLIKVLFPEPAAPNDITLMRIARPPLPELPPFVVPPLDGLLSVDFEVSSGPSCLGVLRGVVSRPGLFSLLACKRSNRSAFSRQPSWSMARAESSSLSSLIESPDGSDGISTAAAGGLGGLGAVEPVEGVGRIWGAGAAGGLEWLFERLSRLSRLACRPSCDLVMLSMWSYPALFRSSVRVSSAAPHSLNFSGSPPLSG
mmetsp:Transcript_52126/g.113505  ORF Transcript_52126/g.113505 Transcript_52126/m.113505 type:complete len:215 (+) Transcript_52126:868-1512(+)